MIRTGLHLSKVFELKIFVYILADYTLTMILHQSNHFLVNYSEKDRLILPAWSGTKLCTEDFIDEMKQYMVLLEKTKAKDALWDHTHFTFQIPDSLYTWIENHVNLPAKLMGTEKIGFIMGQDVMAQFSTMDCFEATQSVYAPRYFSDPSKALNWVKKKEKQTSNPFENEIKLVVENNLEKGTSKIQLELSLEQLPYYLKELKSLVNQQASVHKNYRRFMLLTAREKEILSLVVQGYSNKAIADRLFTSVHTVTTHRKNILKKLECRNMTELVKFKLFL